MREKEPDWNRLATVYDVQLPLERRALTRAADLVAPGPAERLLDLGTGTGAFLRVLARRPARPWRAIGVDRAPAMLRRARGLPPGWRLLGADARGLPFPDASFDAVAAAYVLHLLDDESLQRALAEIRRVLVPGGRLVTITPAGPRSPLGVPYAVAATALRRALPSACAGLRSFDPRAALEAAGLEPRRAEWTACGYPSLCVLAVALRP